MSEDPKSAADARLEAALEAAAVRDPRPLYRPALRHLKDHAPADFERALEHYERTLIPAVGGGASPLEAWLEYGRILATAIGAGRWLAIDPSGRAWPADPEDAAPAGDRLLMFLPDADAAPALVTRCPEPPSAAQQATLDLLVLGRVTLEPTARGS